VGFLADIFCSPRPHPTPPGVIIRNRLGEEIDRVAGWDLCNKDLRNRNWQHVDLSHVRLDGSDLSGTNMLGANLQGASLRSCKLVGCEISYADATECDFSGSDMKSCLMWRTETYWACFENILMDEDSDIPGRKVVRGSRWSREDRIAGIFLSEWHPCSCPVERAPRYGRAHCYGCPHVAQHVHTDAEPIVANRLRERVDGKCLYGIRRR